MPNILEISKGVPFGNSIYWWLEERRDQSLENLERLSYQYERHYLAWEEVRKGRNPFFVTGTGFEGYLLGSCCTPDEALNEILKLGRGMLVNIMRLHRFEYRFQMRLLKTLSSELTDLEAMSEWSAEFGASLARLRCKVLRNRQATAFRTQTYRIVDCLPPISYAECDHSIMEHYAVASRPTPGSRIVVDARLLKPLDQDAWLIMQSIGVFGHPLVREFLRFSAN